jgi:glycosyltransferase involved in cell wall biosynthesis
MKIVYFNYLYDLYGISIGSTIKAERLMEALENEGHEIKIYWRKKQPLAGDNGRSRPCFRDILKKRFSKYIHDIKLFLVNFISIFEEYKILKQEAPDLLIARMDLYVFSALFVSKILKIPIINEADAPCVYEALEFHKEFWSIPKLPAFIEKSNLKRSELNICVSQTAKEYFLNYGIQDNKVKVITNGADVNKFHKDIDSSKVVEKFDLRDKTIIGFVGSFHIWHGVDNLINIIKNVLSKNKDVVFLLVGQGGPMKSSLEDFIKTEKLFKNVYMTGYIPPSEIPNYLSAMNIVVAPYPKLKFFYYSPVKIFEYMACQKPVLTTNIGQISEIITDGENGVLCKPDDSDELLNKLLQLIEDREKRKKIGLNARKTIVESHTWSVKAAEWSDYCTSVVRQFEEGRRG